MKVRYDNSPTKGKSYFILMTGSGYYLIFVQKVYLFRGKILVGYITIFFELFKFLSFSKQTKEKIFFKNSNSEQL